MTPADFELWLNDPARRPRVMGVLNVTPDSFSDKGKFQHVDAAVAHGREMAAAGAAVIDIGGESTRPGSQPVAPDEQVRRVVPVIQQLRDGPPVILSIDTTRAWVAAAALDAGAHVINDISAGLDDPDMLPLAARRRVPIVLMHMQGRPATMQDNPQYQHVSREVIEFLEGRIAAARSAGVELHRILVDPGVGFGKGMSHNLQLLRELQQIKRLGRPMVVGTSRKGFMGRITGEPIESGRPFGTAATVAWAVANGADLVRVHDVGPMSQVARVIEAIQTGAGRAGFGPTA